MQNFFLLKNTVQTYVWGSFDGIPAFTGIVNTDDEPMAELWMGAHPAAPSHILTGKGTSAPLDKFIAERPQESLGTLIDTRYGHTLPFLFKVLSAATPLSLQVHPTREQAEKGFDRETESSVPVFSPVRNYKDRNHKQEILMAITPFTIMCGFKDPSICEELFSLTGSSILMEALNRLHTGGYCEFCQYLLELPLNERQSAIQKAINTDTKGATPAVHAAFNLLSQLATRFPDDIGCLAPLYLNLITLEPGEAVFLPEGIMHTYIKGTGLELMSNSDNILRGGLTKKHLDIPELLATLNPVPYKPEILKPPVGKGIFSYHTPSADFELSVLHPEIQGTEYRAVAPAIVIGSKGEIHATSTSGESCAIARGSFLFIPASGETISFTGKGTCYLASIPGLFD